MEARDSRSKIRPLPVDDIDGDAPHRPAEPQPRRWLPLVVIVVGAIAFGVVARGLSPVPQPDAAATATTASPLSTEPEPTTTTEPPPPPLKPLHRMLPIAEDGLDLVTFDVSARVGRWEAQATDPEFHVNVARPLDVSYNADGSRVALTTAVKDGSLVITDSDGSDPISVRGDVWSGIWHPTDPAMFAWTRAIEVYPGEWETTLAVADVSGFTMAGLEPLTEFVIDGGPLTLLAWDDWGFVLGDEQQAFRPVTRYDPDLQNPEELEGVFFDATQTGDLLMARAEDSGYVPYLLAADGTETEIVGLDIGAEDFRITADGAWVLAVTLQADGHTSILARTTQSRSTRLNSVNGAARIIDLAWDDRFLVLQEAETGDLVFKDWNTGAEFRLPMEADVAAVYL